MRLRWFSSRATPSPHPLSAAASAPPAPEAPTRVKAALRCIPPKLRIPLLMVYSKGMPQSEAAHQLRITTAELRTRMNQALEIFQEEMILRGWEHDGSILPRPSIPLEDSPPPLPPT